MLFTVIAKMRANRFGMRIRNEILDMLSLKDLSHPKEDIKQTIRYKSRTYRSRGETNLSPLAQRQYLNGWKLLRLSRESTWKGKRELNGDDRPQLLKVRQKKYNTDQ